MPVPGGGRLCTHPRSALQVKAVLFERRRKVTRVPRFSGAAGESGARGYEPADGSWDPGALPSQDAWAALPWPRPPRPYIPRGPRDAPMVPPALVHTAVGDRWVAHSSTGVDEGRADGELDGYTYACKLTRAAAAASAAGMVCLPPGVSAVIQRPQIVIDECVSSGAAGVCWRGDASPPLLALQYVCKPGPFHMG